MSSSFILSSVSFFYIELVLYLEGLFCIDCLEFWLALDWELFFEFEVREFYFWTLLALGVYYLNLGIYPYSLDPVFYYPTWALGVVLLLVGVFLDDDLSEAVLEDDFINPN